MPIDQHHYFTSPLESEECLNNLAPDQTQPSGVTNYINFHPVS